MNGAHISLGIANINVIKVSAEIIPTHVEYAIIFITTGQATHLQSNLRMLVPKRTVLAPRTFPFEAAPGISDFE